MSDKCATRYHRISEEVVVKTSVAVGLSVGKGHINLHGMPSQGAGSKLGVTCVYSASMLEILFIYAGSGDHL